MSRIAPPAEKIMAVASIYRALLEELPPVSDDSPHVQAALLASATDIAMRTETRDMGILASPLRQDNLDGTTAATVTDLAAGDHFAYPDDD